MRRTDYLTRGMFFTINEAAGPISGPDEVRRYRITGARWYTDVSWWVECLPADLRAEVARYVEEEGPCSGEADEAPYVHVEDLSPASEARLRR